MDFSYHIYPQSFWSFHVKSQESDVDVPLFLVSIVIDKTQCDQKLASDSSGLPGGFSGQRAWVRIFKKMGARQLLS
jgi:hypothetical protein